MIRSYLVHLVFLTFVAIALSALQISWANDFIWEDIRVATRYWRPSLFSIAANAWLLIVLWLLFKNLRFATVLGTALILFIVAMDEQKQLYLAAHIQPQDIFLLRDLWSVLPSMLAVLNWHEFLLLPAALVLTGALLWLARGAHDILFKPILLVFVVCFPGILYACFWLKYEESWVTNNRSGALVFIPNFNHWRGDDGLIKSYGVVPYLFASTVKSVVPDSVPEGYTENVVDFVKPYTSHKSPIAVQDKLELPDIIVIMSEAFWLASTELKLVDANKASYHPVIDSLPMQSLLVPSYGGGTANTEFEILTGISKYFYPEYSPYVSLVKKNIASALPWTLKGFGYKTVALHPFNRINYRRHLVYPNLGFDQFIAEEDMYDMYSELVADYSGDGYKYRDFIRDEAVNTIVFDQLQAADSPLFLFAVTMQNHGVYRDDRFGSETLHIDTGKALTEESQQSINTYMTGVKLSDQALAQLIEGLQQRDRPALLLFFGDHLPNMKMVYDELGYSEQFTKALDKKYMTPLVVWHNKKGDLLGSNQAEQSYSSVFLGPKILSWAGLPLPPYYQFLQHIERHTPVLHPDLAKEQPFAAKLAENSALIEQFRLLSYDLLEGNGYLAPTFD